ncbi:T6SS phospholipase effector Tle1-like catalytic domain-containing protein [Halomonas sp. BC04]|uniref:T6SS phospholipase effector Tle1-like catalytic domain-containing protein n=1 Tax=Halomonas sp. BC04 TaxID=1403540 RepID=UPI0003ED80F6|nr:DUF2235 domain-containing protein [Halomonas sp. BC04]EWH01376.1 hypothetical protein Q427_14290 [Halomonas sp. BC04]
MKTRLDERYDPVPLDPREEERLRQADRPVAPRSTSQQTQMPEPRQEYRPEPPVPDAPERPHALQIGVFFDGTGNNMANDRRLTDRDITNVVKLHDLYRYDSDDGDYHRVYIHGVGTTTGRESEDGFTASENLAGLGTGVGPEGGHARIELALQLLRQVLEDNPDATVTFDVFGFSRGAALARHFVNLIHRWPETLLVPDFRLIRPGYQPPFRRIPAFPDIPLSSRQVRFVGLFDTVGSFYWPGTARNLDFDLYMAPGSAQRVVQLTAHHEIRRNFPLSSIADAQGNHPGNFLEIALPGAHSDVGGGYENPEVDFANFEEVIVRRRAGLGANGETIRRAQEDAEKRGLAIRVDGMDVIEIERRAIRKELAIYALHEMYREARKIHVPLDELRDDADHVIPAELQVIIDDWEEEGMRRKRQWMLDVSRERFADYIHTSHRQESLAHAPEPSGVRRVFPNRHGAPVAPQQELQGA